MSTISSSIQKVTPRLAKRFEAYALKNNLARAKAFQVGVNAIPVFNNASDARNKIVYEPLPTYVTPRDWTSLFTRVGKYELYCSETPDMTKVTNVTYAQYSTQRFKARLDVKLNSIHITRAEREVLKQIVGSRYNVEKNTISFVSRDLPSMMVSYLFAHRYEMYSIGTLL